jgi:hypothetical protein
MNLQDTGAFEREYEESPFKPDIEVRDFIGLADRLE